MYVLVIIRGRDVAGGDDISFHSKRAMAELDLAVRAQTSAAARAHFSLSSLHLDRMRVLTEKVVPQR
jgi:hypothetical protein